MIKVQNNIATRDPIPTFLRGLEPESLADLSWTDPALGVSDAAWWPEDDQSPALQQYERYGEETLSINNTLKVVVSTKAVVPFTQQEIDVITAEEAARKQQQAVSIQEQITTLQQQLATLENE
jgi:hypothetical protein